MDADPAEAVNRARAVAREAAVRAQAVDLLVVAAEFAFRSEINPKNTPLDHARRAFGVAARQVVSRGRRDVTFSGTGPS